MKIGVYGGQWGDEGKGRIVDYLASILMPDIIARYQGGANAGHSVVLPDGRCIILHSIPSGISHERTYNVLLSDVLLNPLSLPKDMAELEENRVFVTPDRYGVSDRVHMTFDYHIKEEMKRQKNIGKRVSTGRGIAQTNAWKVSYRGITAAEYVSDDFPAILEETLYNEISWAVKKFGLGIPKRVVKQKVKRYMKIHDEARKLLKDFLFDERDLVADRWDDNWLFEGAQGTMLGKRLGNYPWVTTSDPHQTPYEMDLKIAVFKAYASRVGAAVRIGLTPPNVDEIMHGKPGAVDEECGKSTGYRRDTLWFDLVAGRHVIDLTRPDKLALTCLDKLQGVDPVRMITHYRLNGRLIDRAPVNRMDYARYGNEEPEFIELPGFTEDITGISDFNDLPENAQGIVRTIAEKLDTECAFISVGPGRNDIIQVAGL